ncbi:MAG: carboxypeptidase-like regulatory domain-containing protein [Gemmatimonadaceae bacterium]
MSTTNHGAFRRLIAVAWLLVSAGTASAQTIAGTLLRADSTPAAGVIVVAVRPASDSVLARTLTGGSGRYTLEIAPGPVRLRALRIGQRPFVIGTFDIAAGVTRPVRTVLPNQPILLTAMVTTGSTSCRRTGSQGVAVAEVFEEARKALLATQLRSNERRPVMRTSTYWQNLTIGDREASPREVKFIEGESLRPFKSLSPDSLARAGYAVGDDALTTYWAPDAEVLLSDIFAATHCLGLTEGAGAQAGWIGLTFRPAASVWGLVDVSGTLWLDRKTSELRRMEFTYEGLPLATRTVHPGGSVEFTRLPDGLWFISRWQIRAPRMAIQPGAARVAGVFVKGGEVWRMRRGDDLIFTNGETEPAPARHVVVDAPSSMPGVMIDTMMVLSRCEQVAQGVATSMVHGVVHDAGGAPLGDAVVTAEWQEGHTAVGGALAWQTRQVTTVAARDGYFALCGMPRERLMTVGAQYGVRTSGRVTMRIGAGETKAQVDLRFAGARATAPARGVVVRVRDSGGRAVPYALVEVEGGRGRVTDDSGRVVLSAAPDTIRLAARRLGFSPFSGKLGRDAKSGEFLVLLPPIAQKLGAVQVTAPGNAALEHTGFYDRVLRAQRGAFNGEFMTPEELEARPAMRVSDWFSGRRFVQLGRTSGGRSRVYLAGRGGCKMSVLLDGRLLTAEDPMTSPGAHVYIDDAVDPNAVAAIEWYASAANAPAELVPLVGGAQQGACGIVAIWTGSRRQGALRT